MSLFIYLLDTPTVAASGDVIQYDNNTLSVVHTEESQKVVYQDNDIIVQYDDDIQVEFDENNFTIEE